MSRDAVNRTLKRLGDAVVAKHFEPSSDRTLAYSVAPRADAPTGHIAESQRADLPECDSATDPAAACCGIATTPLRFRDDPVAESPHVPLYGEVEEGEGEAWCATEEPPGVATVTDQGNAPAPADLFTEETQDDDAAPASAGPRLPDRQSEIIDADPDDLEPQPFCDRHMPDGTDDACGACKRRRRRHEAWECRQPVPMSGQQLKVAAGWFDTAGSTSTPSPTAAASPEPARQCPWCHDTGLVLMSDGLPGSDPSACNHDNSRRPATSDDIAEYERRRRLA